MTLQERILAVLKQFDLVTVPELIALLNSDGYGELYPNRQPGVLLNAMTKALKALVARGHIWRVEGSGVRYRGRFATVDKNAGYPRSVSREAALQLLTNARDVKLKRHTLITGQDRTTTLEPAKARYWFEHSANSGMQEIMPGVFAFLIIHALPHAYERIEITYG